MDRRLSPQDAEHQAQMREYFTQEFPDDLRGRSGGSDVLDADAHRRAQRTLAEAGLAAPGWPV